MHNPQHFFLYSTNNTAVQCVQFCSTLLWSFWFEDSSPSKQQLFTTEIIQSFTDCPVFKGCSAWNLNNESYDVFLLWSDSDVIHNLQVFFFQLFPLWSSTEDHLSLSSSDTLTLSNSFALGGWLQAFKLIHLQSLCSLHVHLYLSSGEMESIPICSLLSIACTIHACFWSVGWSLNIWRKSKCG